jgi:putative transcriptional regulator
MVAEQREKRGLSQNQLAKKSGVPQSVISDIESGKTKAPRIDTLVAIAEALETNVTDLIAQKAG